MRFSEASKQTRSYRKYSTYLYCNYWTAQAGKIRDHWKKFYCIPQSSTAIFNWSLIMIIKICRLWNNWTSYDKVLFVTVSLDDQDCFCVIV